MKNFKRYIPQQKRNVLVNQELCKHCNGFRLFDAENNTYVDSACPSCIRNISRITKAKYNYLSGTKYKKLSKDSKTLEKNTYNILLILLTKIETSHENIFSKKYKLHFQIVQGAQAYIQKLKQHTNIISILYAQKFTDLQTTIGAEIEIKKKLLNHFQLDSTMEHAEINFDLLDAQTNLEFIQNIFK